MKIKNKNLLPQRIDEFYLCDEQEYLSYRDSTTPDEQVVVIIADNGNITTENCFEHEKTNYLIERLKVIDSQYTTLSHTLHELATAYEQTGYSDYDISELLENIIVQLRNTIELRN